MPMKREDLKIKVPKHLIKVRRTPPPAWKVRREESKLPDVGSHSRKPKYPGKELDEYLEEQRLLKEQAADAMYLEDEMDPPGFLETTWDSVLEEAEASNYKQPSINQE